MSHKMRIDTDKDGRFFAFCSCRRVPHQTFLLRWQADDLLVSHQQQIDRARAGLQRGGTLNGDYEWAMQQAADPENSEVDRALWKQLADGYRSRLGTKAEEDSLF